MSDKIPKEVKKNKISIKRIVIALALILLSISTFCLLVGLYHCESCPPVVTQEECEVCTEEVNEDDIDEEEEEEEKVCNWKELMSTITSDTDRVKDGYVYLLEDDNKAYEYCRPSLFESLGNIIKEDTSTTRDEKDALLSYSQTNTEYLIDNTFLINLFGSKIWAIDLVEETVELFWNIEDPVIAIDTTNLYLLREDNETLLFFPTMVTGLGGPASEAEYINNLIEIACSKNQLATWMYDTSTEEFTMIKKSEMCN